MSDPLAERLERCYSGAVYDVLRARGITEQVLPPSIRPLDATKRVAGRIFTVSGHPDPERSAHETFLSWTGLLSRAPKDTVVICQPNDSTMAHMGELSAETLKYRGIRGYVVDGGCRDSEFILRLGFPVHCRYFTPVDVVGRWVADEFGKSVAIGNVQVHTGDYVVADRDGIVIIPADIAEDVTAETETVLQTENKVRKAILEGMDPQQAYLEFGKF